MKIGSCAIGDISLENLDSTFYQTVTCKGTTFFQNIVSHFLGRSEEETLNHDAEETCLLC